MLIKNCRCTEESLAFNSPRILVLAESNSGKGQGFSVMPTKARSYPALEIALNLALAFIFPTIFKCLMPCQLQHHAYIACEHLDI
jgi:hypothetical protein